MTDNTRVVQGADFTVATDVIDGIAYQRNKLVYGADGSATDVGHDTPLPVTGALANGQAVRYPLLDARYRTETLGTASATYTRALITGNPTGLGYQLTFSVPFDGSSGARIVVPFSGRCFGVMWHSVQTTPDFSVTVDGEAVRVPGWLPRFPLMGITNQIVDAEASVITHDYLPRGRHVAEIALASNGVGTISLSLYGVLLDRGSGYESPPRTLHAVNVVDLPDSATALTLASGGSGERTMRGIRKIIYYNKSGGAITVTIENNSVPYWAVAIPAGETREFDPGGVLTLSVASGGWTHKASAASSINATLIEGY